MAGPGADVLKAGLGALRLGPDRWQGGTVTAVLVCDASPLVREGFRRALAGLPGLDRVLALPSAEALVARWIGDRPDLVLLDARLPGIGGAETVRRVVRADPSARVMMLTMPDDEPTVMAAVAAGARGYLYKNASRPEVRTTVSQILVESGAAVVSPGARSVPDSGRPMLTERELEVLAGMCEGRSNAEIGRSLFLSEDTVKTHARRLFKKLGAVDRAHAVALGYRWGLVR
jgi:DNA-binding NarL/FixJ family response regulator